MINNIPTEADPTEADRLKDFRDNAISNDELIKKYIDINQPHKSIKNGILSERDAISLKVNDTFQRHIVAVVLFLILTLPLLPITIPIGYGLVWNLEKKRLNDKITATKADVINSFKEKDSDEYIDNLFNPILSDKIERLFMEPDNKLRKIKNEISKCKILCKLDTENFKEYFKKFFNDLEKNNRYLGKKSMTSRVLPMRSRVLYALKELNYQETIANRLTEAKSALPSEVNKAIIDNVSDNVEQFKINELPVYEVLVRDADGQLPEYEIKFNNKTTKIDLKTIKKNELSENESKYKEQMLDYLNPLMELYNNILNENPLPNKEKELLWKYISLATTQRVLAGLNMHIQSELQINKPIKDKTLSEMVIENKDKKNKTKCILESFNTHELFKKDKITYEMVGSNLHISIDMEEDVSYYCDKYVSEMPRRFKKTFLIVLDLTKSEFDVKMSLEKFEYTPYKAQLENSKKQIPAEETFADMEKIIQININDENDITSKYKIEEDI